MVCSSGVVEDLAGLGLDLVWRALPPARDYAVVSSANFRIKPERRILCGGIAQIVEPSLD